MTGTAYTNGNGAMKKSARPEDKKKIDTLSSRVPESLKVQADAMLAVAKQLQARLAVIVKDPQFKIVSGSAGAGALTLGTMGGAGGLVAGSATGFAVGIVPALFTFGLSMPTCAAIGGSLGMGVGAVTGAGSGLVVGGVSGKVAYAYRVEIKNGVVKVKAKVMDITSQTRMKAKAQAGKARAALLDCVESVNKRKAKAIDSVKGKAAKALELAKSTASEKSVQVSAASAATGAVALGATGGAAGLATGTVVGAAVGVVPALFTFGLSIPIGAMVGGGSGLCIGAATGGSAGFAVGGAAGYAGYSKRKEIQNYATYMKNKAKDSVTFVETKIRGATGGTI